MAQLARTPSKLPSRRTATLPALVLVSTAKINIAQILALCAAGRLGDGDCGGVEQSGFHCVEQNFA